MTIAASGLDETTQPIAEEPRPPRERALVVTICHHPDLRRVGERFRLAAGDGRRSFELSRLRPEFQTVDGRPTGPLADPHLSRAPLLVLDDGDGGVLLRRARDNPPLLVAGRPLAHAGSLSAEDLEQGATVELSSRVVLLLHASAGALHDAPKFGLVGESDGLRRVRSEILHIGGLALPTLLRGESGTGKELVARAIHASSPAATRPYVTVNLAAINPQTAVAELFGHARGAFTGAFRAREGYFREADGGTLFLDEIGEAATEVQVMLLRALETGEIQPVGGGAARRVDVRVIAATDANLEEAVLRGNFRPSLLHRLAGYELWLPPLRHRRDDIPRLLHYFLHKELAGGAAGSPGLARVLTAPLVARLLRYDWPGNIRELHNIARQLAVLSLSGGDDVAAQSFAPLMRVLAATADAHAHAPAPATPPPRRVPRAPRAAKISDAALLVSLQHNRWGIDATARELGISKTSLYALIDRCPHITKARDIPSDALMAVYERCGGDLERMSDELRVSLRGLKLRIRELNGKLPPVRGAAAAGAPQGRAINTRTP